MLSPKIRKLQFKIRDKEETIKEAAKAQERVARVSNNNNTRSHSNSSNSNQSISLKLLHLNKAPKERNKRG